MKTRVGVLLRDTVGGTNASSNTSLDVEKLTQRYYERSKKMQIFMASLQEHYENLKRMEASRQKIAQNVAMFTKGTPLFDCTGILPSSDRPSNTVCSYASIHEDLASKSKSYTQKYSQFVLEYAVEWEKIVRERVEKGIKKTKELRIELDHYQKKVEALRLQVNQTMAKGKPVANTTQERLRRNEEKFLASKQNYNQVATDVSILLEEVVERSWRDLHPLLVKCSQFDMTLASDEARVLSNLQQVISSLKQVAIEHGISPQPRLKDLASLKPELLSTRPGGIPTGWNAIEAGPSTSTNMELAPGTVGPQGMGGFPVPILNDPAALTAPVPMMNRTNSLGTSSLGSVQSAPYGAVTGVTAPTFDDVYGNRSAAPSTGGFGNHAMTTPTNHHQWNNRPSHSFNDADSAYSGYSSQASAPAPMGAPPPPPMGAPMSMAPSQFPQQTTTAGPLSMYPPPMSTTPSSASHSGMPKGYNPFG